MSFRLSALLLFALTSNVAISYEGASVVSYYGYDDCIELTNGDTRVVLCPAAGGRVLEYSRSGKNMMYLPSGDEGWRAGPNSPRGTMNAGRFDIGPEMIRKRGRVLWEGRWEGEIIGDRHARLVSQFDSESGVRLVRDFELHESSTRFRCTQTIRNESDQQVSLCHWSRTFAIGGGIAIVPRQGNRRFPHGHVIYKSGKDIITRPSDPNIEFDESSVIIYGPPEYPKLGFDSYADWMAYLAPNDQMFVKRFKTYPDRAYNELLGLTSSVWYPESDRVELEPIGPAENLEPGEEGSFSEEWYLIEHAFPKDRSDVEFQEIARKVRRNTATPLAPPEPPVSPEVHSDGRITFRFTSRSAKSVQVKFSRGDYSLARDGDRWSTTIGPFAPGIYDYVFEVDGSRVTDPRNRWVKKWKVCASLVEIPGTPALITQRQNVPHGTVHRHFYDSPATGAQRPVIVYTPPGYSSTGEPYPVLVLCHGNGDDETAWTEVGRAHFILDNLISEKKIVPMVVVMPHGHPVPLAERNWSEDSRERNRLAMVKDVAEGILPWLPHHYHVREDAMGRAVTGLSMGGGQSIAIGMTHPELFHWVGAFSASAPHGVLPDEHPQFKLSRNDNQKRRLFWIACGKDDFLLERNQHFTQQLKSLEIDHQYVETDGAHSWEVWRRYLPEFLQMIFVDKP